MKPENKEQVNYQELDKEMEWLTRVIDYRIKTTFGLDQQEKAAGFPPPPELAAPLSPYGGTIRGAGLCAEERLIIVLALAPLLKPQILDIFFTQNKNFDREYTEFGGEVWGKRFIPTIQTALFLLAGEELEIRIKNMNLFLSTAPLFKNNILQLDPGKSLPDSLLCLEKEYEVFFLQGASPSPGEHPHFPARPLLTSREWDDLVFPCEVLQELEEVKEWQKYSYHLMKDPVLEKIIRPGFRVLFCGPPGTGKSFTAALLGKAVNQPVYRVDLAAVLSKYIGETEKNLSRVFQEAEKRCWILFFDEADAIFGKRSSVSSSNDRFANQEVAYLLQRIEEFQGLIILASNLKENMDQAFFRRFEKVIFFPFPSCPQRLELWRRSLPPTLPLEEGTDLGEIAGNFRLSGGTIVNAVIYASIKAIKENSGTLKAAYLREGAHKELAKEESGPPDTEDSLFLPGEPAVIGEEDSPGSMDYSLWHKILFPKEPLTDE